MSPKTKKQHYVPQCYLRAWAIPGKHQIYVFDKNSEMQRINNIQDVASERFFYDVNPDAIFSERFIESFRQEINIESIEDNTQFLERALSEEIEKPFSDLLKDIIEKASKATPWYISNCYFTSMEKKLELSFYLALQFLRTKNIRNSIQNSVDCLTQVMKDMGVSNTVIDKYNISKKDVKDTHIKMILDAKSMAEIMNCFYQLTWVLGVNKTNNKLFTSDSPIATQGHIKDSLLATNGLASKGVEVFFPISPDVILIMVDGSYHTHCLPYERKYIEIDNDDFVNYYNSILAMQADRFIFSSDNNMALLDLMKKKDPNIFKSPKVQMSWGGKTYYPSNG